MILSQISNRLCSAALFGAVFSVAFGIFAAGCVDSAWAQAEFNPRVESSDDDGEQSKVIAEPGNEKKTAKGANFTKYTQALRLICAQVDEDGRREALFKILEPLHEEVPDCPGCKSLLRTFAGVCKAARAKPLKKKVEKAKAKEEPVAEEELAAEEEAPAEEGAEAQPTAAPKPEVVARRLQREPSTKLLDTISTTFIQLSEDERRSADAARAMQVLAEALSDPDYKTPGERDYFEILAAYMYAPFAAILQPQQEAAEPQAGHNEAEKPAVDDLFTF